MEKIIVCISFILCGWQLHVLWLQVFEGSWEQWCCCCNWEHQLIGHACSWTMSLKLAGKTWNLSNKVLPSQAYPTHSLTEQLVQQYPVCPVYSQRKSPYCPVSSGSSIHLVTVNKLVQANYTDTGPLKHVRIKHDLWLLLVLLKKKKLIFLAVIYSYTCIRRA